MSSSHSENERNSGTVFNLIQSHKRIKSASTLHAIHFVAFECYLGFCMSKKLNSVLEKKNIFFHFD